ncbi:rhomboid family protein [Thecamonas trahens ATCC 50062]|uniref:Rhomboid family protein n=1 Tax=Thecamonas trahens ATCC 50062 TaxID=461836 RepID=A0A0L0D3P9_THETB|nr:rhomboid family protein [Thecamonas trahens ATCC 50062]KNC46924.1 rhomboid family protein [Thecamonas trahens ATCC 50062]|eukprot:XP_013760197.1 rhomboid family protein [Thecamonas trahens ATCC 50062]
MQGGSSGSVGSSSGGSQGVGTLPHRVRSWLSTLPAITRAVLLVCVAVYLLQILAGTPTYASVCLSPVLIVYDLEVSRLVTHAFVHAHLLHLFFNMSAFYPMAMRMERALGSFSFAYHMALMLVLAATSSLVISLTALYVLGWPELMFHCDIGLSGVIFGMIVLQTMAAPSGSRYSVFGFFDVPTRVYPFALLFVVQMMMPGSVSFIGHLTGIIAGFVVGSGWASYLVPKLPTLAAVESARPVASLVSLAGSAWISVDAASGIDATSILPTSMTTTPQPRAMPAPGRVPPPTASDRPAADPAPQSAFPGQGHTLGSA